MIRLDAKLPLFSSNVYNSVFSFYFHTRSSYFFNLPEKSDGRRNDGLSDSSAIAALAIGANSL